MSGITLPVQRPTPSGRALVVGSPGTRSGPTDSLRAAGHQPVEADDPYTAMAELCRRPTSYRIIVLSLASLYREELAFIPSVKQRFPQIEVWLAHTDGRAAALAEAMRLGADGLMSDDGFHRFAAAGDPTARVEQPAAAQPGEAQEQPTRVEIAAKRSPDPESSSQRSYAMSPPSGEPVLTADELRALLQEIPARPSGGADVQDE